MQQHKEARGLYRRGGVWWLSYQKNHKRHWVTLETTDYATAVAKAADVKAAPVLNAGGRLTAETDRFRKWKVTAGEFTRATDIGARGFLRRLVAHFGDVDPAGITEKAAQDYYAALIRSGMKVISARTYIAHAASFFAWCVDEARTATANPFAGVEMDDVTNGARKRFCEPELRDQLIRACKRDDLRFVLYCGFHAGMRKNEIINARPEWFDLKRGLIHITKIEPAAAAALGLDPFDLKDREDRTIPLSRAFAKFLLRWKPAGAYCLAPEVRTGLYRYRYDFRRPYEEFMAGQDARWVDVHTLRRTFASLQVSQGTSLYHVAKWLGDDIKTVMKHYAHLMPDHAALEQGLRAAPRAGSAPRRRSPRAPQTGPPVLLLSEALASRRRSFGRPVRRAQPSHRR